MRKTQSTTTSNGAATVTLPSAVDNCPSNDGATSYLRLLQNEQARQNIHNISKLLNTGLSTQTLDICVKLCEAGVHPQSLAEVVRQLRSEQH